MLTESTASEVLTALRQMVLSMESTLRETTSFAENDLGYGFT